MLSKAKKRASNALKGMDPRKAFMNFLPQLLPDLENQMQPLVKNLEELSRPKEEGGLLEPGQESVVYVVTTHEDRPVFALCAISTNEAGEKMLHHIESMYTEDLIKLFHGNR